MTEYVDISLSDLVYVLLFQIQGRKLFMLKNPWNHLRWKGHYSENDMVHWTPELQKAVNYDPKSAQMVDNGLYTNVLVLLRFILL